LGTLLTGGEGCQALALVGQSPPAWRQTFLPLPQGISSHETCGRVLARLHPPRFQPGCRSWTQAVAPLTPGARVWLDGKTVSASLARATAAAPWPMLSAWGADPGGRGLGPTQTATQAPESTALPALLPWRALTGGRVPMEARGCQTASAGQSRGQGGDALLAWQSQQQTADAAGPHPWQQHLAPPRAWRTAEPLRPAMPHPAARGGAGAGPSQPCRACLREHNGRASQRAWSWKRCGWRTSTRLSPVPIASPLPVWDGLPPPASPCSASIGPWSTRARGRWTSPARQTAAVSGRTMPPKRGRRCGTALSIGGVKRTHAA
jgi:hypothetical protein